MELAQIGGCAMRKGRGQGSYVGKKKGSIEKERKKRGGRTRLDSRDKGKG